MLRRIRGHFNHYPFVCMHAEHSARRSNPQQQLMYHTLINEMNEYDER
jgi:hypothetical protein